MKSKRTHLAPVAAMASKSRARSAAGCQSGEYAWANPTELPGTPAGVGAVVVVEGAGGAVVVVGAGWVVVVDGAAVGGVVAGGAVAGGAVVGGAVAGATVVGVVVGGAVVGGAPGAVVGGAVVPGVPSPGTSRASSWVDTFAVSSPVTGGVQAASPSTATTAITIHRALAMHRLSAPPEGT
jgi:hypothetical protein